jgi:hypothetical protein
MSALPSKYVPVELSILGVCALLVSQLLSNDTVSSLWDRVRNEPRVRTFDRFATALTVLFAGSILTLDRGVLRRAQVSGRQK